MTEISPELWARFERCLGQPVERLETIQRGYTPALRLRVHLRDGRTVFIKKATTGPTAEWLRREYVVYSALDAPFLPRLVAWDEGDESQGSFPFLALEDLSAAHWPPPWSTLQINQVIGVIERLAGYTLPGIALLEEDRSVASGWQTVAEDPQPFLGLRLATQHWLEQSLPTLLAASRPEKLLGNDMLHGDVRSDNICFDGERVVLVDWNLVRLGNRTVDLAFWLPSLEAEGGPAPEVILPHSPEFAAIVSGYFAARAGLSIIPDAPRVRMVQLQQLRCALPWAVRALGLPRLDGTGVRLATDR